MGGVFVRDSSVNGITTIDLWPASVGPVVTRHMCSFSRGSPFPSVCYSNIPRRCVLVGS